MPIKPKAAFTDNMTPDDLDAMMKDSSRIIKNGEHRKDPEALSTVALKYAKLSAVKRKEADARTEYEKENEKEKTL